MSNRPSDALMSEAAGWIAAQLSDEGVMVGVDLVELLLGFEWHSLETGIDANDRTALIDAVCERTVANGVQVGPSARMLQERGGRPNIEPVPRSLVEQIVSWEDDFLSLAGIQRG